LPRLSTKTSLSLQGRLKLAHLLEMPERELDALVRRLESKPAFRQLKASGVLSVAPFPKAGFTARRFAGWGLKTSSEGLPELVDGEGDVAALMKKVGQKRFEECFLGENPLKDEERARRCRITAAEARRLREFLDRAYLLEEFEKPAPLPEKVFSSVAGFALEEGKPVLGFFNREIWKGRYRVDEQRLNVFLRGVPCDEQEKVRGLLKRLEYVDLRKTTLYRALEALMEAQAEYLRTGDPDKRQALTQRSLAVALGVDASVLNRLVSNKSVQLPWGLEAPLKALLPSGKKLALDRLYELVEKEPSWSDERLRREMAQRFSVHLSRRSITQYRKDLGLARRGRPQS